MEVRSQWRVKDDERAWHVLSERIDDIPEPPEAQHTLLVLYQYALDTVQVLQPKDVRPFTRINIARAQEDS